MFELFAPIESVFRQVSKIDQTLGACRYNQFLNDVDIGGWSGTITCYYSIVRVKCQTCCRVQEGFRKTWKTEDEYNKLVLSLNDLASRISVRYCIVFCGEL